MRLTIRFPSGPRKPSSGKQTDTSLVQIRKTRRRCSLEKVNLRSSMHLQREGPIKVSKFNTLDDAKKFLAQVKGEGMNGIISKGGKPVKEDQTQI